jgi:formylglycine-generating enzyme required for sulfatase activity
MKNTVITLCLWVCVAGMAVAQTTPLCLGDNYYQKRMVKVFEALQEHKLDKAAKCWQEIEEKASSDNDISSMTPISQQLWPVWQLSEAMMMNIRDGRGKLTSIVPYNPWGAYKQFKNACCSSTEDWQTAEQFLSHKNLKMHLAELKADFEKSLIDTVRLLKTEEAYDQLIELLYDYPDMATVEGEREMIAYDKIKHCGELSQYQRYLDKYGELNKNHHFTIEWRRDSTAFEQMGKTAAACKAYLAAYPKSQFNNSVQDLLHKYAFEEMDKTVEACQEYQRLYPKSEYNDTVKSLEVSYAFRDAKELDNIGAYRSFLDTYPESPFEDEVKPLLQQAFERRYFSQVVTLDELHRIYVDVHALPQVDRSRVNTLYQNLVFMPTSAFMKGYDGALGKVLLTDESASQDDEEIMIFNDQGLMVRHFDSRKKINDSYTYGFDPEKGFVLLSKVDAKGNTVSYATKWNEYGDILEIAGSDGTTYGYTSDYEYMKRVARYNGRKPIRTDYYNNNFRIDKSVLAGNVNLVYRYNDDGDVAAIYKKKGKNRQDSTTYEYDYLDRNDMAGRTWFKKMRYDNGKYQTTIYRNDGRNGERVACNTHSDSTVIDWSAPPLLADTVELAALVTDLNEYLSLRAKSYNEEAPATATAGTKLIAAETPKNNESAAAPTNQDSPELPSNVEVHTIRHSQVISEEPEMVFRLYDDEQPKTKEELLKKLISDMVLVEGGIFMMGATPEQEDDAWELEFPAHQVKLSSFYMCRVEVTQALWEAVMGSNPSAGQGWNRPVEMVSWDDCSKFINRLNEMTGITFRLPTEAEWEYAARGGNRSGHYMYAGSDELDKVAWYKDNSEDATHPVGGKQPNELGLYDMSGNVWEWCVDWQNFYSDDIQINPVGEYKSQGRVMRGGCWKQTDTLCRVSFRGVSAPEMRTGECGLRLVATKLTK